MWRRSQTAAALAMTTTMQRSCRSWWSSLPHQKLQTFYRGLAASSSPSSSAGGGDGTSGAGGSTAGRKRHRFFNNNNNSEDVVPSFRDFQLRFQLRSLYRKYWRLASSTNADLRRQIRAEFRSNNNKTTPPNGSAMILDERAISEGNRRYKELQNVLSAAGTTTTGGSSTGAAVQNDWPWNKQRDTKPEVFPPKSTTPPSSSTTTGQ
jgi:Complex 1 protein (LYR family)